MSYQASPDRIQFDIAQCLPEVIFIHWSGKESILPEVSGQVPLDLLPPRKIVMQSADAFGKRVRQRWDQDLVGMVRHERIACHVYLKLDEVFAQNLKIDFSVGIGEKHSLALIAALGDVVRVSRDDNSCDPWHHRRCFSRAPIISRNFEVMAPVPETLQGL
jgi:hypothetical protein